LTDSRPALSLSLFVVNPPPARREGRQEESYLFQVGMELQYARGFVPRPNRRGEDSKGLDDATADLPLREEFEWAVGHNVSIESPITSAGSPRCS
jgi:hypothetical protein